MPFLCIWNFWEQHKWLHKLRTTYWYSRTSPYGHLSNTDTSLIRTVHLVPGKCPYILCKNNLYNTDNGHEISAPERKFIQTEPLYYGHSNDDSSYSTRFPVCRYISECNQLSHCSYDNSIMFSIGKNYTIDMSLPFIIKISYSLKTLQLLLSFFYLFSFRHFHLKDYLYGQLGFL